MSWRRATALNLAPGASSSEDPQLLLFPPLAPPLYPGDDLHLASRPLPLTALERKTVSSMNVSSQVPIGGPRRMDNIRALTPIMWRTFLPRRMARLLLY